MMGDKTGLELRFWPQIIIVILTGNTNFHIRHGNYKLLSAGTAELALQCLTVHNSGTV